MSVGVKHKQTAQGEFFGPVSNVHFTLDSGAATCYAYSHDKVRRSPARKQAAQDTGGIWLSNQKDGGEKATSGAFQIGLCSSSEERNHAQ